MDGGEPLPYWVDKFKLNKDKEKSQKQKSKNKKKQKLEDATPSSSSSVKVTTTANRLLPPPPPPQRIPREEEHEEEDDEGDDLLNTGGGAFSSVGGIPGMGLEAFSEPNDVDINNDDDEDEEEGDDEPASMKIDNNKKRSRKSVADDEGGGGGANRENLLVQGNGIPDFERYVFPLAGWMYTTTMMKGASKQAISKSSILKPSPAERLAKTGDQTLKHIGKSQGGQEEEKSVPPPPKQKPNAVVFVVPSPKPPPTPPTPPPPPKKEDTPGERVIPMLDIRLAKHSFVSAQLQAFKERDVAVNPLFRAYFSGGNGPDPTGLLTDFIDFLDAK